MSKIDLQVSLKDSIDNLIEFCNSQKWIGHDPYDGLNSPILRYLFFDRNIYFRLLIIQFFKNFPINLRPLFFIKKEANPKGLALCLKSLLMIYKHTGNKKYLSYINYLVNLLLEGRSTNSLGLWGYNFDWQSRAFFVKKYSPNLVVSYFVLDSFYDLYNLTKEERYRKIFINSCDILIEKFLQNNNGERYFKYVLHDKKIIHNVNFFGASLMSKAFILTKDEKFRRISEETLITSVECQSDDGSWSYGKEQMHKWVDSFHTCYNLLSLNDFMLNTGIKTYENRLVKGFNYFINNFFKGDSIIKYYDKKIYPIDIHSFTTGLITLIKLERYLEDKRIIIKIYNYLEENFKGTKGIYYYRIYKLFKNKIPYMRWSQSWLLYSLVLFYEYIRKLNNN